MSLRNQYIELTDKIDAITLRERMLIGIVGLVFLIAVGKYLASEPIKNEQKLIQKQTSQLRQNITSVQEKMNSILQAHQDDSGESIFDKKNRFNRELKELDNQLNDNTSGMTDPAQVLAAMKSLLEQQGTLKILAFKNYPSEPILEPSVSDPQNSQPTQSEEKANSLLKNIFMNRMILVFEGNYFETLNYVKSLEKLKWQFFWDELKYEVSEYPNAKVTLKLHTLASHEEKHAQL